MGIQVSVSHFPPGTSKGDKIEHRLFCHITQNWRGKPLISHQVIVNLIANTTTRAGLRVEEAFRNLKGDLTSSHQWKNSALWELCGTEGPVDIDLHCYAAMDRLLARQKVIERTLAQRRIGKNREWTFENVIARLASM